MSPIHEAKQPPPEQRRRERISQDPEIERRFNAGSERMDRIEAMIVTNSADTAEVLEIIRLGKSFFKLVGHLGSFIKWATAIGAPVVAFYYAIKGGKL